MTNQDTGQAGFSVDDLIDRAAHTQAALESAAASRRDGLERLMGHARDLIISNGDLSDRVDLLEAAARRADIEHADEVLQLQGRIRALEGDVVRRQQETADVQATAAARENELNAEVARVTDLYGRVAREFQRFVSQVDRQAVSAAEDADVAERGIVAMEARQRPVPTLSVVPAPQPVAAPVAAAQPALAPASNLLRMPIPSRREPAHDAFDEAAEFDAVRRGFGAMAQGGGAA